MENQYVIIKDKVYVFIPHKGVLHGIMFDSEDLPRVFEHYKGVTLSMNGSNDIKYAGSRFTPQRYLHRFIMGLEDADCRHVDHIDRNPLNNCKSNLRVLSARQNSLNRRVRTNTGLRYIHQVKDGYEFRFNAKFEEISVKVKRATLGEILAVRTGFIEQHRHLLHDHVTAVAEFQ